MRGGACSCSQEQNTSPAWIIGRLWSLSVSNSNKDANHATILTVADVWSGSKAGRKDLQEFKMSSRSQWLMPSPLKGSFHRCWRHCLETTPLEDYSLCKLSLMTALVFPLTSEWNQHWRPAATLSSKNLCAAWRRSSFPPDDVKGGSLGSFLLAKDRPLRLHLYC